MAWKFPAKDGSSDNKKQNGDASSEALLLEVLQIPKSELKKLKKTALMGKLFPIVSNFFVSKSDLSLQQIAIAIADLVDEMEVAVFVAVGWGLVPFTRSMYDVYLNVTSDSNNIDADDTQQSDPDSAVFLDEDETAEPQKSISRKMYEALTPWDDDEIRRSKRLQEASTRRNRRLFRANMFQKSLLYQIVDHVSQAARVGISVIAVDCIALVGKLMGHNANTMDNFSRIFSKVAYTGWITHRLQVFKSYLLRNTFGKAKGGYIIIL